jgi:hypothetical protein
LCIAVLLDVHVDDEVVTVDYVDDW